MLEATPAPPRGLPAGLIWKQTPPDMLLLKSFLIINVRDNVPILVRTACSLPLATSVIKGLTVEGGPVFDLRIWSVRDAKYVDPIRMRT